MEKPAIEILEEQIEWAQDRIIYAAIEHITDNFDSFPVMGLGLSFMKRSAERMIVKRLEDRIVPEIEAHVRLQWEYVEALLAEDDPDADAAYREQLLDTDPFLTMVDAPKEFTETLRERVAAHHREIARDTVAWIEEAGDETYADYADLVVRTGKDSEYIEQELTKILQYIEWLEDHRDHVDLTVYSSLLEHQKVHDWFLDVLIAGLKKGQKEVIDEITRDVRERQEIASDKKTNSL